MRGRHWILCLVLVVAGVITVRSGLAQTSSGSWSTVAPMRTARGELAAVTGADGRIYAIGGLSSNSGPTDTVEAYNPRTNTWRKVARMPTARAAVVAATSSDGRIYAIGGLDIFNTPLRTVEAYNPRTNTWACSVGDSSSGCSSTRLAPMPTTGIFLAAATGSDGRIYVIGGTSGVSLNTVEAYSPSTNAWSTVASLPIPTSSLAAVTGPDGRVYAIGGVGTNIVEAYTPATNTWSAVAPMPTARCCLAAATGSDGRIYAIGGTNGGFNMLNAVEAYDPSTNAWSSFAPLPTARYELAATAGSDGRIYAIGGLIGSINSPTTSLHTVEVYTPTRAVSPAPTATPSTTPSLTPASTPSPTPAPRVVVMPVVSRLAGIPGAATASFTVSFSSAAPGHGEVYFGSGPGCMGLVEVATHDLHPGTTDHTVVVAGNDLPGTVGNNGVLPGITYWFEVLTITSSGTEIDTNNGACYSVTIPIS